MKRTKKGNALKETLTRLHNDHYVYSILRVSLYRGETPDSGVGSRSEPVLNNDRAVYLQGLSTEFSSRESCTQSRGDAQEHRKSDHARERSRVCLDAGLMERHISAVQVKE